MKPIIWTEQSNFFGLDYSSKKGVFHDYEFDIRYDYEGDPKVKPENCGLYLTIQMALSCCRKNKTNFKLKTNVRKYKTNIK
jgi:hypothetical protein